MKLNRVDEIFVYPTEIGFVILIKERFKPYKYIGENNSITLRLKPLPMNFKIKGLKNIILFQNPENIINLINKYREKGIDARLLSVSRDEGNSIIDDDDTDEYMNTNYAEEMDKLWDKYLL